MSDARVIGVEHIEDARRRGRKVFEILPGDIVTSLAEETASRLGLELVYGHKLILSLTDLLFPQLDLLQYLLAKFQKPYVLADVHPQYAQLQSRERLTSYNLTINCFDCGSCCFHSSLNRIFRARNK